MSALDTQPQNLNFLASTGFRFFIKKLPTVNFFVQSINIPGAKLELTQQPTPFVNVNYYGDKMVYNDFAISFAVDEDLKNYLEIYNWIQGLARPTSFVERQLLDTRESSFEGKFSDCVLTISTNVKKPNINVFIKDAFPISISDLVFRSTANAEDYLTAAVVFKYTTHAIQRI